jgi:hypothetical protein
MKKNILFPILLLLFCSQINAQTNSSNLVFDGVIYAIVKTPDGSTYVGGDFTSVSGSVRNHLAKINADGTLNSSFNPNLSSAVKALAIDSLGNLFVGGVFTNINNINRLHLAKFNNNGLLDSSFHPSMISDVLALAIDPFGYLYVGGDFTSVNGITHNHLVKINADGTINSIFNPNIEGFYSSVLSLVLDSTGNLYVGGNFTSIDGVNRNRLAKYNVDGLLDNSINPNINGAVYSIKIDSSGNLYLGGLFNNINGVSCNHLAKINADGTFNTSFNPNINALVRALCIDSSDNLYVGGDFTTIGGVNQSFLVKINTDGTLINNFNPSLNYPVVSLAIDSIGNLYVGGGIVKQFAIFNGVSLGNTFLDKGNVTYYPNPTTGVLNINYSKEISAFSVVNLLGQTVLTQSNSGMAAQLDLSSLVDGTYIVKMVSDGKTQTFKVLKGAVNTN